MSPYNMHDTIPDKTQASPGDDALLQQQPSPAGGSADGAASPDATETEEIAAPGAIPYPDFLEGSSQDVIRYMHQLFTQLEQRLTQSVSTLTEAGITDEERILESIVQCWHDWHTLDDDEGVKLEQTFFNVCWYQDIMPCNLRSSACIIHVLSKCLSYTPYNTIGKHLLGQDRSQSKPPLQRYSHADQQQIFEKLSSLSWPQDAEDASDPIFLLSNAELIEILQHTSFPPETSDWLRLLERTQPRVSTSSTKDDTQPICFSISMTNHQWRSLKEKHQLIKDGQTIDVNLYTTGHDDGLCIETSHNPSTKEVSVNFDPRGSAKLPPAQLFQTLMEHAHDSPREEDLKSGRKIVFKRKVTYSSIVKDLSITLPDDASPHKITGLSFSHLDASPNDLIACSNLYQVTLANQSKAQFVLTTSELAEHLPDKHLVIVGNVLVSMMEVVSKYTDGNHGIPPYIDPSADIDSSATIHWSTSIGSRVNIGPSVVIEKDVLIGDRVDIHDERIAAGTCITREDEGGLKRENYGYLEDFLRSAESFHHYSDLLTQLEAGLENHMHESQGQDAFIVWEALIATDPSPNHLHPMTNKDRDLTESLLSWLKGSLLGLLNNSEPLDATLIFQTDIKHFAQSCSIEHLHKVRTMVLKHLKHMNSAEATATTLHAKAEEIVFIVISNLCRWMHNIQENGLFDPEDDLEPVSMIQLGEWMEHDLTPRLEGHPSQWMTEYVLSLTDSCLCNNLNLLLHYSNNRTLKTAIKQHADKMLSLDMLNSLPNPSIALCTTLIAAYQEHWRHPDFNPDFEERLYQWSQQNRVSTRYWKLWGLLNTIYLNQDNFSMDWLIAAIQRSHQERQPEDRYPPFDIGSIIQYLRHHAAAITSLSHPEWHRLLTALLQSDISVDLTDTLLELSSQLSMQDLSLITQKVYAEAVRQKNPSIWALYTKIESVYLKKAPFNLNHITAAIQQCHQHTALGLPPPTDLEVDIVEHIKHHLSTLTTREMMSLEPLIISIMQTPLSIAVVNMLAKGSHHDLLQVASLHVNSDYVKPIAEDAFRYFRDLFQGNNPKLTCDTYEQMMHLLLRWEDGHAASVDEERGELSEKVDDTHGMRHLNELIKRLHQQDGQPDTNLISALLTIHVQHHQPIDDKDLAFFLKHAKTKQIMHWMTKLFQHLSYDQWLQTMEKNADILFAKSTDITQSIDRTTLFFKAQTMCHSDDSATLCPSFSVSPWIWRWEKVIKPALSILGTAASTAWLISLFYISATPSTCLYACFILGIFIAENWQFQPPRWRSLVTHFSSIIAFIVTFLLMCVTVHTFALQLALGFSLICIGLCASLDLLRHLHVRKNRTTRSEVNPATRNGNTQQPEPSTPQKVAVFAQGNVSSTAATAEIHDESSADHPSNPGNVHTLMTPQEGTEAISEGTGQREGDQQQRASYDPSYIEIMRKAASIDKGQIKLHEQFSWMTEGFSAITDALNADDPSLTTKALEGQETSIQRINDFIFSMQNGPNDDAKGVKNLVKQLKQRLGITNKGDGRIHKLFESLIMACSDLQTTRGYSLFGHSKWPEMPLCDGEKLKEALSSQALVLPEATTQADADPQAGEASQAHTSAFTSQ